MPATREWEKIDEDEAWKGDNNRVCVDLSNRHKKAFRRLFFTTSRRGFLSGHLFKAWIFSVFL
jgi:hypothetical protein